MTDVRIREVGPDKWEVFRNGKVLGYVSRAGNTRWEARDPEGNKLGTIGTRRIIKSFQTLRQAIEVIVDYHQEESEEARG